MCSAGEVPDIGDLTRIFLISANDIRKIKASIKRIDSTQANQRFV